MAIIGAHVLLYTSEPEAVHNMFRDVFGFEHVDGGDGLIFALPLPSSGSTPPRVPRSTAASAIS
jgi:hypothetical protein